MSYYERKKMINRVRAWRRGEELCRIQLHLNAFVPMGPEVPPNYFVYGHLRHLKSSNVLGAPAVSASKQVAKPVRCQPRIAVLTGRRATTSGESLNDREGSVGNADLEDISGSIEGPVPLKGAPHKAVPVVP